MESQAYLNPLRSKVMGPSPNSHCGNSPCYLKCTDIMKVKH